VKGEGPGEPGSFVRVSTGHPSYSEPDDEQRVSDTEENLVRIACAAILDHIGEESYGAGPARDALEGFKHRLQIAYPELVGVVEEALRGRP
jgi:hypothetical protein